MSDTRSSEKRDVKSVIMDTLQRDFHHTKIVDVLTRPDVDRDGDPLLIIEVIYEGMPGRDDLSAMTGAIGHIRPALMSLGEDAFPLISFISKSDAKAAKLGTT
jgi:hypothetical protein